MTSPHDEKLKELSENENIEERLSGIGVSGDVKDKSVSMEPESDEKRSKVRDSVSDEKQSYDNPINENDVSNNCEQEFERTPVNEQPTEIPCPESLDNNRKYVTSDTSSSSLGDTANPNQSGVTSGANDDKEDPEEFQACDNGSDTSESENEYESAEEGEEMKIDAQTLAEIEETLTDEEKEERRQEAQKMKGEGNDLFKCGTYKGAIRMYSRALRTCPLKFAKDRSIMYSNRAACKMKLGDDEACIKDCTKAIDLHPHYLRPLLRRAELYEKTEKLDEALADYQKVLELDPGQHSARAACMKLPEQIKERNEKLKEEMMGKLKDLGNMILRPFGLSTNNFQLNQDPNTGGYSVNFQQNPQQNNN